jgi:hypothetical protein
LVAAERLRYEFDPDSPAGVAHPETTAAIGAGGSSADVALYGAGAVANEPMIFFQTHRGAILEP